LINNFLVYNFGKGKIEIYDPKKAMELYSNPEEYSVQMADCGKCVHLKRVFRLRGKILYYCSFYVGRHKNAGDEAMRKRADIICNDFEATNKWKNEVRKVFVGTYWEGKY